MISPRSVLQYQIEDFKYLKELEDFRGMKHFLNTRTGAEYCTNKEEWKAFQAGLHLRDKYISDLEAIVDYVTDLAYKQNPVAVSEALMSDGDRLSLDEQMLHEKEIFDQKQEKRAIRQKKRDSRKRRNKKDEKEEDNLNMNQDENENKNDSD